MTIEKAIYFALDGSAPMAKVLEQRNRRKSVILFVVMVVVWIKSFFCFEKKKECIDVRRSVLFNGSSSPSASAMELTPGTNLMNVKNWLF